MLQSSVENTNPYRITGYAKVRERKVSDSWVDITFLSGGRLTS
jgi:hypothetical protein